MSEIRAIPTRWKGYTFRSRTEARWAVFFTAIGIEFDYEPQGFQLSDGNCYLPDFHLPVVKMFGEVKPTIPGDYEERKARLLALGTGHSVLFLDGPPEFRPYYAATWDSGAYTWVDYSLDIAMFSRAYADHRLWSQPERFCESDFSDLYRIAVYASRSERFEH